MHSFRSQFSVVGGILFTDSPDDSYLLTGYEPKDYDLKETYVESHTESPDQPTGLQARVPRGRGVR